MSEKRIFHSLGIHTEGAVPTCICRQTCLNKNTYVRAFYCSHWWMYPFFVKLWVFLKTIKRQQNAVTRLVINILYVFCGTELDSTNAVDNNCMSWNKHRDVGTVGGCFPSLKSTGTVTWSDRKDLWMFHITNTHWWKRRMKKNNMLAHPSPIYDVRSASLTLIQHMRTRFRYFLFSNFLSSTKCFTGLSSNNYKILFCCNIFS